MALTGRISFLRGYFSAHRTLHADRSSTWSAIRRTLSFSSQTYAIGGRNKLTKENETEVVKTQSPESTDVADSRKKSKYPVRKRYSDLKTPASVLAKNEASKKKLFHFADAEASEQEYRLVLKHKDFFLDEAEQSGAADKKTFKSAVERYCRLQKAYRRGHVEFIFAAMQQMEHFDVHKDLDAYKYLLLAFPKGPMVLRMLWEIEMKNFPKQQDCAMDIMSQMQRNRVCPDDEFGLMLAEIFGTKAHCFRKYQRMMYWLPKFKFADPFLQVPNITSNDPYELAKLAMRRMQKDIHHQITVFECSELEESADKTFIVSCLSPDQEMLLTEHPVENTLFVEGPFRVWTRDKAQLYFILRAEPKPSLFDYDEKREQEDDCDFKNLASRSWFMREEPSSVMTTRQPTVHEQDDGTIMAMCITGTSTKDSLISWIKFLERSYPTVAKAPVVFKIVSLVTDRSLMPIDVDFNLGKHSNVVTVINEEEEEEEVEVEEEQLKIAE